MSALHPFSNPGSPTDYIKEFIQLDISYNDVSAFSAACLSITERMCCYLHAGWVIENCS